MNRSLKIFVLVWSSGGLFWSFLGHRWSCAFICSNYFPIPISLRLFSQFVTFFTLVLARSRARYNFGQTSLWGSLGTWWLMRHFTFFLLLRMPIDMQCLPGMALPAQKHFLARSLRWNISSWLKVALSLAILSAWISAVAYGRLWATSFSYTSLYQEHSLPLQHSARVVWVQ